MSTLENKYFNWLKRTYVACPGYYNMRNYSNLLGLLHATPYITYDMDDENVAYHGLARRRFFVDELNWGKAPGEQKPPWLTLETIGMRPASMLEMMCGFALHIYESHFWGLNDYDHFPPHVFWMFIENLELDQYDDEHFDTEAVTDILNRLMTRQIGPDGKSGMFRFNIESVRKNSPQIHTDLWHQENYWQIDLYEQYDNDGQVLPPILRGQSNRKGKYCRDARLHARFERTYA